MAGTDPLLAERGALMVDPTAAGTEGGDPRLRPGDPAAMRPVVARRASANGGLWLAIAGAVVLGLLVMLFLTMRRAQVGGVAQNAAPPSVVVAAPPPPADLALTESQARAPAYAVGGAQSPPPAPPLNTPAIIGAPAVTTSGPSASEIAQRRRAPSLVVDLAGPGGSGGGGSGQSATPAGAATAALSGSASAAGGGGGAANGASGPRIGAPQLSGDEQFADRIGTAEPERAQATSLRNPHFVVPQGTMIPAVLETAMNSDLPGFVRAVVSRDVRGFDGTTLLVPRGSRLVGQYRSGLSQGASRIFVIWTRLLRPDGASVQIGSPGGDPLGRAGQAGKVHSHFFREFASSILLSVVNAEVSNLANQPNTQIVVGGVTTGATTTATPYVASPYAVTPPAGTTTGTPTAPAFPPTITVMQGAPISIFVARDLDFSSVENPGG